MSGVVRKAVVGQGVTCRVLSGRLWLDGKTLAGWGHGFRHKVVVGQG